MGLYARILRVPGIAILIASTTISRLPFAINGLAVILFLREETGSFAIAGAAAGGLTAGAAIGAPLAARLVDRRGVVLMMPLAVAHAAAILGVWALGESSAPTLALVATCVAAGTCFPPSGSVLRSRWPQLLDDAELVRGAYALDSVTIEVSFVTGPLITAAIVAASGPESALGLSAALVIFGNALFVWKLPGSRKPAEAPQGGFLGALASPAIRMIVATTIPVGFCVGTIEVAIPAFSDARGTAELAGVLLALWSLSSGVGGLLFGIRAARGELVDTYLRVSLLFPLLCAPVALAGSSPVAMGLLVMAAGAPIAPLIASRNELIATIAPLGSGAEAFTWLMTSLVTGLSLGTALGGAVIEVSGWPEAVLAGAAVATLGSLAAFAFRRTLRPAPVTA